MANWLITTDLDGTLLNHHTYDVSGIAEIIERLQGHHIPVILNSSKTLAELSAWRHQLNLSSPIIAENGGVVAHHATTCYGALLADFLPKLQHWRDQQEEASFVGFSDWSVAEVAEATGLSVEEARLAKTRWVTEPIQWLGTKALLKQFQTFISSLGLQCVAGGRFYHLMGRHSKATALQQLLADPQSGIPTATYKVLALGDGENDRAMLMAADVAVVMPSGKGTYLNLATRPGHEVIYSPFVAPSGWIQTVNQLIFQETV
jgi:mannosyl-3-phosphoglycerate phosphatase